MEKSTSQEERMMTKIINSAENCLEFDNDDAPNDSSLLLLATALKKSVSSVKDLSLNFYENSEISQNGWSSFYGALGFLTSLKKLNIKLTYTNQSAKSLKKLGENLEELRKLEDLNLQLVGIQQRHGKGWEFLFSSFKRIVNLRNLVIQLDDYDRNMKLSDRSLLLLSERIQNMQKLKKLTVCLTWNSLSQKVWSYFFETISQCLCLTDLELTLSTCISIFNIYFLGNSNCEDYSICHLTTSSLKRLKILEIDWYGSKISQKAKENFHNSMIDSGFQGTYSYWSCEYKKQ